VHVDAEGAAIDLRSTQLDQLDQGLLQRQLGNRGFQAIIALRASGLAV
jgi:hypothetical protein